MARKIVHQLVDDLDGTELAPGAGESISFALEGKTYEIDLTDANAEKLREAFAPYIAAGRRLSSGQPQRPARRRSANSRDLADVRRWAKDNGYTVSERGRVPGAILEAYDAAH